MSIGPQTLCFACKRLRSDFEKGPVCAAFPDGIPKAIIRDGFDHRQPYPGDGGARFVHDEDKPLPSGYAEEATEQEPVFITKTPEIRTQTDKDLRGLAGRMIEALKQHPER